MTPERFLDELRELRQQYAAAALAPSDEKRTEFGYGQVCGIDRGLKIAEQLYEKIITEQEQEERGGKDQRVSRQRP